MSDILDTARHAYAAGACVIPVKAGKVPAVQWKKRQTAASRSNLDEIERWFADGRHSGLGIITGRVSGGLEMLEFEGRAVDDGLVDDIKAVAPSKVRDLLHRITRGYSERTPSGGLHLYYYLADQPVPGNVVLAARPPTDDEKVHEPGPAKMVLIETRGEGGYSVVAPSNGAVHPTGKAWTIIAGGVDSIETITASERDELHELLRTFDRMPAKEYRSPTMASGPTGDRPGDHYNAAPDAEQRTLEILLRHGWTEAHRRKHTIYLTRPGKSEGWSATLGHVAPGVLYVFSTSTIFESETAYSPFQVFALLEHGGDFSAAAKALVPAHTVLKLSDPVADEAEGDGLPPRLPAEFWEARDYLAHVRQAAYSAAAAPDGVLASVLARQAALVDYTVGLPGVVGAESGLSLFTVPLGASGLGKSSGFWLAEDLLPGTDRLRIIPGGSGEGMVDAFFEFVEKTDDEGKSKKVKMQVRHQLLVFIDEGQAALQRAARQGGGTFFSTLRSMFTGGMVGEANATQERYRNLPRASYSVGVVLIFQPEVIADLLSEATAGTPQRFLYLSAVDPTIPDEAPEWPGPLPKAIRPLERHAASPGSHFSYHFTLTTSVARELRDAHLARVRGLNADEMGSHRGLLRLKVAALLSYMDARLDVNADDWRLAGMVVDTSDAVRTWAEGRIGDVAARREDATAARLARRAVRSDAAVEQDREFRVVARLVDVIKSNPGGLSPGKARAQITATLRDYFDVALQIAVEKGWIVERHEPGQGDDKVRLFPGSGGVDRGRRQPLPGRGFTLADTDSKTSSSSSYAQDRTDGRGVDVNPINPYQEAVSQ